MWVQSQLRVLLLCVKLNQFLQQFNHPTHGINRIKFVKLILAPTISCTAALFYTYSFVLNVGTLRRYLRSSTLLTKTIIGGKTCRCLNIANPEINSMEPILVTLMSPAVLWISSKHQVLREP